MPDATDMALVREYCARQSEPAFETLVHRHVNLVYSTALRQVGNPAQAEEITQAVFIILARKAARLRPDAVLAAWLHETARYVAASYLRGEIRRRRREQEAYMQSMLQPSSDDSAWEQLAPLLDEAIGRLGTADRNVVALRYFQNKSAQEIAAALNIGEAAAKKRLARAVEKLRRDFFKRGINVSTTALSGAVLTHSVQAAPVALAKSVTAVALAKGATAPISTLTLIKGALKIMAWTKAKMAVVAAAVVIVAAGTTTVVVKKISSPTVDESLWSVNEDNVLKAPPVLIIRPARYPNRVGSVGHDNKVIGLNMPISGLLVIAYEPGFGAARMIFPPGVARQHYDLMLTLPDHESESLRNKLKTQLGLVARREIVETNVLWLKVKDAAALESRISKGGPPLAYPTADISSARIVITNQPISVLADQLEGLLQIPTVDQTGLNKNFDINLKWNRIDPQHDSLRNALLDQLGLELVPGRESIEMLVVEKAK
jgi:uncharacterized protein (TIGR03435 family)